MSKKERKLLDSFVAGVNGKICVYEDGERYFGTSYQNDSGKICREWVFDAYDFLAPYFLYQLGNDWFCLRPETAEVMCLGKRLAETFYVSDKEDGTQHYAYFNYDGEYSLQEGDAQRVEDCYQFPTKELFVLAFETANFCKIFYLSPWEKWTDPAEVFTTIDREGGYLYLHDEACEDKNRCAFFHAENKDGYHLIYRGTDLSHYRNAFVEKESDKFVLYIYDGENLVVAEEGNCFHQNNQGIVLGDKFWACRKDIYYLLDPTVKAIADVPDELAEQLGNKKTDEVLPYEEEEVSPELKTPEKIGFFRRLCRWLGFRK